MYKIPKLQIKVNIQVVVGNQQHHWQGLCIKINGDALMIDYNIKFIKKLQNWGQLTVLFEN